MKGIFCTIKKTGLLLLILCSLVPVLGTSYVPALHKPADGILTKNFYFLYLLEKHPIGENSVLEEIAATRMLRLDSAVTNCSSGTCYADAMQFTPVQIHQIGGELIRYAQKYKPFLYELRSSNFYSNFDTGIDSVFVRKSWESVALSMNRILNVYLKGTPPTYPKIDAASFDPLNKEFLAQLNQKLGKLAALHKGRERSFYRSTMLACIQILLINGRDEAIRYEPLQKGSNSSAVKHIGKVDWDKYRYSVILVPGLGPEQEGVRLDPNGAKRCDSAAKRYYSGLAPFIVVSGGHVHPNKTPWCEAVEMKKYLVSVLKIPDNVVFIEPYARHTTTNLRNLNRMIFNFRIPEEKEVIIVTDESQSRYIQGNMAKTAIRDLGYLPYEHLTKISPTESAYLPNKLSLHANPFDPLDP